MSDEMIGFLIWVVIAGVAGIWKLLSKFLGAADTVRKVAQAGKQTKGLLDTLMSGDFEELKRAVGEGEKRKPIAPSPKEPETTSPIPKPVLLSPQSRPAVPPAVARARERVMEKLETRTTQRTARPTETAAARQKKPRVAAEGIRPSRPAAARLAEEEDEEGALSLEERAVSLEEGVPSLEEGPRPRAEVPSVSLAPATVSKPTPAIAAEAPVSVLALLRRRRPKTIRELVVVSELLGPPKAMARRSGRGLSG